RELVTELARQPVQESPPPPEPARPATPTVVWPSRLSAPSRRRGLRARGGGRGRAPTARRRAAAVVVTACTRPPRAAARAARAAAGPATRRYAHRGRRH